MKDVIPLLKRLFPFVAFLGGFVWDALTIGRRVATMDLWILGGYLLAAALLALFLARRPRRLSPTRPAAADLRSRVRELLWLAPYLALQFLFGGIFSALFILYFKSSGHFATWLMTALLGALLVGNEFAREHYGRRMTLVWTLFALNAILLCNFALPHVLGSLDPRWFHVSTAAGVLLAHLLRQLAPHRSVSIVPAYGVGLALWLAWSLGMIAPVPLVKRDLAVGQAFVQEGERFALQVEQSPRWAWWRTQATTLHVAEGERLYGVAAVWAPQRVTADLEHRWEVRGQEGWREVYRNRYSTTGGRERGFRGYSWVLNPQPGQWRFTVATQDGRTVSVLSFEVVRGSPALERTAIREF